MTPIQSTDTDPIDWSTWNIPNFGPVVTTEIVPNPHLFLIAPILRLLHLLLPNPVAELYCFLVVTGFIQIQRLIFPLLRVCLFLHTLYWLGYKIPMKIEGTLITVGSDGIHYIKIVRKEM